MNQLAREQRDYEKQIALVWAKAKTQAEQAAAEVETIIEEVSAEAPEETALAA